MEPRFAVDANVGRLAKWLRAMGYDSLFIPDVDDGELLWIAESQDRIIVTKDRHIMRRRVVAAGQVKAVLVSSDDFREQMQQLTETLGLTFRNGFTLCIECNEPLRRISKEQVGNRVPPFVFSTQHQFNECPGCGKLYWRGTHWRNMRQELAGYSKGT